MTNISYNKKEKESIVTNILDNSIKNYTKNNILPFQTFAKNR